MHLKAKRLLILCPSLSRAVNFPAKLASERDPASLSLSLGIVWARRPSGWVGRGREEGPSVGGLIEMVH